MLFEIFNKAYYKDSIIDKIYRGDTLIYQFGRATQNQSLTAIIIEDINYSVSAQSLNTSTSGYLETIYYNISSLSLIIV